MTTILIVEDNHALASGVALHLRGEGYEVFVAESGTKALAIARKRAPRLVVLDLTLPDMDGFDVLRAIRADDELAAVPVLILTARPPELGALAGFRLGADDYVAKPFRLLEVAARIAALLRRSGESPNAPGRERDVPEPYSCDLFEITPAKCEVRRGGALVPLRPKEYDLLIALVGRRGSVVSRADLLREVWGYDPMVMSRTVDTHVAELRRKLERDPAAPEHILTVRSRGYRMV